MLNPFSQISESFKKCPKTALLKAFFARRELLIQWARCLDVKAKNPRSVACMQSYYCPFKDSNNSESYFPDLPQNRFYGNLKPLWASLNRFVYKYAYPSGMSHKSNILITASPFFLNFTALLFMPPPSKCLPLIFRPYRPYRAGSTALWLTYRCAANTR